MRVRKRFFDGADAKMDRLGLAPVLAAVEREIQWRAALLTGSDRPTDIIVLKTRRVKGGIWTESRRIDGILLRIDVRMRVTSRREIFYKDALQLRHRLENGDVDLGVMVVPSMGLQRLFSRRISSACDAIEAIRAMDADRFPLILVEIEDE